MGEPFKPSSLLIKRAGLLLNIVGVGAMILVYSHHIMWVIPQIVGPMDDTYYFRLYMEYLAVAWSLYVLVGNYIGGVFCNPGFSDGNSYKLTPKSYSKLRQMGKDSQEFKRITYAPTYKDSLNFDVDISEYKDSFGYGLFGDKGNASKFPRTHHCSVCKQGVYFMDHHGIWLNNCIGYRNRRYFSSLLFACGVCGVYYGYYGFSSYYELMSKNFHAYHQSHFWKIDPIEFMHIGIYHAGLISALAPGLWFAHITSNSSKGMTTMENKRDPFDTTYDLDFDRNWEIVYGHYIFPFSWLMATWAGKLKSHNEYMKMWGLEAERVSK